MGAKKEKTTKETEKRREEKRREEKRREEKEKRKEKRKPWKGLNWKSETDSSCSSIGASSGMAPVVFKGATHMIPFACHGNAKKFLFALFFEKKKRIEKKFYSMFAGPFFFFFFFFVQKIRKKKKKETQEGLIQHWEQWIWFHLCGFGFWLVFQTLDNERLRLSIILIQNHNLRLRIKAFFEKKAFFKKLCIVISFKREGMTR